MEQQSSVKSFGGFQNQYTHQSSACNCEMTFSVYLPPQAEQGNCPALVYLSGLTCNDQNVVTKAGYQAYAAKHGIIVVAPDTSPRGEGVADVEDEYDAGQGAGFYVNSTQEPWAAHFQMYDYIVEELYNLIVSEFPIDPERIGITGHSMGGHGALVLGLRNQDKFKSISAFSPIVAPTQCPWGDKAFGNYLGDDVSLRSQYDAVELIKANGYAKPILIDQGLADNFLDEQLKTQLMAEACEAQGVACEIRMQEGYDHSYFFISSFIADHIKFHAGLL